MILRTFSVRTRGGTDTPECLRRENSGLTRILMWPVLEKSLSQEQVVLNASLVRDKRWREEPTKTLSEGLWPTTRTCLAAARKEDPSTILEKDLYPMQRREGLVTTLSIVLVRALAWVKVDPMLVPVATSRKSAKTSLKVVRTLLTRITISPVRKKERSTQLYGD